ncbi:hypothetical protein FVE85_9034 [Porphyridium purpureum]|uniref:GYF domain-containing protein n=1 Tax=Porphyridium purpureum TaxID=35688 RepID=A0A5J4YPH1_PORPP|nr:hypothetical protein FVE85_9034 [Porphyridium purpureum]|eukprot:POR4283..scf222_8
MGSAPDTSPREQSHAQPFSQPSQTSQGLQQRVEDTSSHRAGAGGDVQLAAPQAGSVVSTADYPDPLQGASDYTADQRHAWRVQSPHLENPYLHAQMQQYPQHQDDFFRRRLAEMHQRIVDDPRSVWVYLDPREMVQGPFSAGQLMQWLHAGFYTDTLMVKSVADDNLNVSPEFRELRYAFALVPPPSMNESGSILPPGFVPSSLPAQVPVMPSSDTTRSVASVSAGPISGAVAGGGSAYIDLLSTLRGGGADTASAARGPGALPSFGDPAAALMALDPAIAHASVHHRPANPNLNQAVAASAYGGGSEFLMGALGRMDGIKPESSQSQAQVQSNWEAAKPIGIFERLAQGTGINDGTGGGDSVRRTEREDHHPGLGAPIEEQPHGEKQKRTNAVERQRDTSVSTIPGGLRDLTPFAMEMDPSTLGGDSGGVGNPNVNYPDRPAVALDVALEDDWSIARHPKPKNNKASSQQHEQQRKSQQQQQQQPQQSQQSQQRMKPVAGSNSGAAPAERVSQEEQQKGGSTAERPKPRVAPTAPWAGDGQLDHRSFLEIQREEEERERERQAEQRKLEAKQRAMQAQQVAQGSSGTGSSSASPWGSGPAVISAKQGLSLLEIQEEERKKGSQSSSGNHHAPQRGGAESMSARLKSVPPPDQHSSLGGGGAWAVPGGQQPVSVVSLADQIRAEEETKRRLAAARGTPVGGAGGSSGGGWAAVVGAKGLGSGPSVSGKADTSSTSTSALNAASKSVGLSGRSTSAQPSHPLPGAATDWSADSSSTATASAAQASSNVAASASKGSGTGGSGSAFGTQLSPEFKTWCENEMNSLTGSRDTTLVEFLMTCGTQAEVTDYVQEYLGASDRTRKFALELFQRMGFEKSWNPRLLPAKPTEPTGLAAPVTLPTAASSTSAPPPAAAAASSQGDGWTVNKRKTKKKGGK